MAIISTTVDFDSTSEPADAGMIGWTGDPVLVAASAGLTSGRIVYQRIRVPNSFTTTGGVLSVGTVGSTLTSGQNLMALLSANGTRLALSTDQTSNFSTGTGVKQCAWTATYTGGPGIYYVAVLSVGTTPPLIHRFANTVTANTFVTTPISSLRAIRSSGTANTTIPSTVDWSTDGILDGTVYWMGIY